MTGRATDVQPRPAGTTVGATSAHQAQFYHEDAFLIEAVARFVGAGLGAGDPVIAIATERHVADLGETLRARGLDLARLRADGRYVTLDAASTLSEILLAGRPDRERLAAVIARAAPATNGSSSLRIFGGMIALLLERGETEAALGLEDLWNELRAERPFSLLCAYPMAYFEPETRDELLLQTLERHGEVLSPESSDGLTTLDQRKQLVVRFQEQVGTLASERALLAALVESSDDAIVGKTLDGIVTSWNRAAERIFGYSAQEMIGRSITRIIPPERPDDFRMILESVRRGVPVDHYETERVRKDGRRIFVSLTVSPIKDTDGRIIGVSKIARDVTERHRLAALREQVIGVAQRAHAEVEAESRAKDEFLAILGHELRNPLAAIRNAVESAQLEPRLQERALGIAGRQTRQLARLVDDLLDVVQITRGRTRLKREAVSLAELVDHAVEASRFLLEEQGHTLSVSLPGEGVRFECDALRIEQVLVNLLTNAAKYTPRSGRIEVRAERENGHAVIRVRDNGIGIAGDDLPRIFEPFVQAGQGGGPGTGGLGVGLTVARSFVVMHGGTIEAHSAGLGGGAEFVVRLPAPTRALEGSASPAVAEGSITGGIRVLVVDDNRDVAEGMAMLVELFGCSVCIASDGPSALEAARAEAPAVMLVDIGLPGMDGYEVARRVRASPQLSRIELVAVTGYGMEEDRRRARAAGFAHHLTKPVDPAVLRGLIASITAAQPRV